MRESDVNREIERMEKNMSLNLKMKMFYVTYQYGNEVEFIDGPFGTFSDAFDCKYGIIREYEDDERLIIVSRYEDVEVE